MHLRRLTHHHTNPAFYMQYLNPLRSPSIRTTRSNSTSKLTFSTTSSTSKSKNSPKSTLPPRPTLPTADLKHTYLKGSGPGGQKINKTSSAVQLTHLPTGTVVKSQATRSRTQNHNIARRILAEKIEFLEKGPESRAAKVVERARRKKASSSKKKRRKYRLLNRDEGDLDNGGADVDADAGVEQGILALNDEHLVSDTNGGGQISSESRSGVASTRP